MHFRTKVKYKYSVIVHEKLKYIFAYWIRLLLQPYFDLRPPSISTWPLMNTSFLNRFKQFLAKKHNENAVEVVPATKLQSPSINTETRDSLTNASLIKVQTKHLP